MASSEVRLLRSMTLLQELPQHIDSFLRAA